MRQTNTVKRAAVKTTATPKNRLETPLAQTVYSEESFYQKVREKAYQLFVERGCENGHDVEDWLHAEQIVRGS